ncbi:TniQ family protein [Stenomitos frigidus]|uniref:HTH cro/C1-type domain-containing protein n=1 Tax=Stenomitos frigidus ULC18 TaxID=2107698 RepID=A0A2T1EE44_9CYAN|nr:TniQ family protein [Stenomitos frigidus]PSB31019.1 hypothetical protein C7B82_07840 [Stenomitos frigidus ULC18]
MNIKTYVPTILESWTLNKSSIPLRSQLYQLEPIGIGTPFTESLTSLISRLAMAHCLPPGVLMTRLMNPLINKAYGGANLHNIYSFTDALNGTGEMAKNLVEALQALTLHDNLCLLTMLPWSKLLPHRHLLHNDRTWCSACYQDWFCKRQTIYEPLLWSLEVIQVCPLHRQELLQQCPHCHKKNYPLAWHSRPGFCSKCHEWLGASPEVKSSNQKERSKEELAFEIWAATTVGGFIASTSNSAFDLTKDRIAKAFCLYVNHLAKGNIAEFARQLKVPRNTLWLWCQGNNRPTFTKLVEICFCLGVSLSDFLTADTSLKCHQKVQLLPTKHQPTSRADAKPLDLQSIELYLKEILESDKQPYPSLEQVARTLGRDRRTIAKHLPELCRAIATRYLDQKQAIKLEAIAQCCQEVRQAILELHEKGVYPSEGRIAELLTRPGFLRYKEARKALYAAKQELGLEPE